MEGIFRQIIRRLKGPEIAIFHEFHKPPYGGGNQFLLALEKEFRKRGFDVGRNKIGQHTRVVLFNSYNFDFGKLSKIKNRFPNIKLIHRVDGPISTYRGEDRSVDDRIWKMNHELADKTIFQSRWSLNKHLEMGLSFKEPVVITNACDPEIFHSEGRASAPANRKTKLIATSWSDNPKKGGPLLAWLDEHLDAGKYELTFVGRTQAEFKNAKVIDAVPSEKLAQILREHDIYIAPSQDDPCSNALIEALSCGLPAVFLNSGGHPELVKEAGEAFNSTEDLLSAISKVSEGYVQYQQKIRVSPLSRVVEEYLKVFQ